MKKLNILFILLLNSFIIARQQYGPIRLSTDLSLQEYKYLENRFAITKKAIEELVGHELKDNEVPRIAFCYSGGGYRSMIYTVGSLSGAQDINLLQAATYVSGISGGTWAIAPWISSGQNIKEFRKILVDKVQEDLFHGHINTRQLAKLFLERLINNYALSLVDLYGALLAQKLLSNGNNNPQKIYLHEQANNISNPDLLYPIYVAAIDDEPYKWLEFTPDDVGSNDLGGYIASYAFECSIKHGVPRDCSLTPTLGYLMGIWGAAFGKYIKEVAAHYQQQSSGLCDKILAKFFYLASKYNIAYPQITNFAHELSHELPVANIANKYLPLTDMGIYCNLPIYPLLRKERQVDIILAFDNSSDINNAIELNKAEQDARNRGLNFAEINYENIDKSVCSIFESDDINAPTIIYLPRLKNEKYSKDFDPSYLIENNGYCKTSNFKYTKEQFEELSGLGEFNIKESKDLIINAIKNVINKKRKNSK